VPGGGLLELASPGLGEDGKDAAHIGRAGPAGHQADPNVPRGATEITVGHGRAWLVPGAQGRAALVVAGDAAGGQVRDLVIGASGLSQAALVSLVSDGLKAA
jgi:hypothetical protein